MSKYQFLDKRVPIAADNISIVQDLSKCKKTTYDDNASGGFSMDKLVVLVTPK